MHICACPICKQEGADQKKCVWRQTHKLYIKQKSKAIVKFRKLWRQVKNGYQIFRDGKEAWSVNQDRWKMQEDTPPAQIVLEVKEVTEVKDIHTNEEGC